MKHRGALTALIALALLAQAVSGVRADSEASSDFIKRLIGRSPGKGSTAACFSRAYGAAHLAAHPRQNVREMLTLVLIDSDSPDSYSLTIGARFRSRKALFETTGDCGWPHAEPGASGPPGAHCSVSCDGCSMDVSIKNDGAIYVKIPEGANVWRPGDRTTEEGVSRRGAFGADDQFFRVDRANLGQCLPIAFDDGVKALLAREK